MSKAAVDEGASHLRITVGLSGNPQAGKQQDWDVELDKLVVLNPLTLAPF